MPGHTPGRTSNKYDGRITVFYNYHHKRYKYKPTNQSQPTVSSLKFQLKFF